MQIMLEHIRKNVTSKSKKMANDHLWFNVLIYFEEAAKRSVLKVSLLYSTYSKKFENNS